MARDLGGMGENLFRKLCSEVSIKCNSSKENDASGWDFVVEFPESFETLKNVSQLEKDFSKSICKVQIKSSDSKGKSCQVKLSNLKRFVNDVAPAFFIFFEFDGKKDVQRAYLIHVGKEIIERTIKRLREKDVKNERDINKVKLAISYSENDLLEEISGEAIEKRIKSFIGPDLLFYTENKIELLKTVGYEGPKFAISFKTRDSSDLEALVDSMLGLGNFANVGNISISEIRFGIDRKIMSESEGRITIGPSVTPSMAQLIAYDDNGSEISRIETQMYSPGRMLSALPKHLRKVRFASEYFDVIIHLDSKKADLKLNPPKYNDRVNIFQLEKEMDLILKLIHFERMGIERNGEEILRTDFQSQELMDPMLNDLHLLLARVCKLLKSYDIYSCNTTVNAVRNQQLSILLGLSSLGPIEGSDIKCDIETFFELKDPAKVSMIFDFIIRLGDWNFGMVVGYVGVTTVVTDVQGTHVTMHEPYAKTKQVIKRKGEIKRSELAPLMKKVQNSLTAEGYDYIVQKGRR